jgi:hypothetical protein
MADKEATARIKINKLLEAAGWRFLPDGHHPANVFLEPSVAIKSTDLDAFGHNFEKLSKGFIDFLLCDAKGFPLIILEAKAEQKNPLSGKTLIAAAIEAGQWDRVIDYVNREVFDKPKEYYTLDKLRKAAAVDRRLTLREILEKIFGLIPSFKSKDELLEEEFAKFVADTKPDESDAIPAIKTYFKAYITSDQVRHIIESKQFTDLATNPVFSTRDFKAVPAKYRTLIPEYVKDYVSLNQFAA